MFPSHSIDQTINQPIKASHAQLELISSNIRYSQSKWMLWMLGLFVSTILISQTSIAESTKSNTPMKDMTNDEVCEDYGPQTPRDIDQLSGANQRVFSLAPSSKEMNLCNIHFHKNAEHKAEAFSLFAGEGKYGGYRCKMGEHLSKAELKQPKQDICNGLQAGDTIEVHWVHTSCAIKPGAGLGSCLSEQCANPDLRVETQVFTLVNDNNAANFNDFDYSHNKDASLHQAKVIPYNTGAPVVFAGSTTGPSYTQQVCSPLQVTWSVRPQCAKLDIKSLCQWCKSNVFDEDHAHGVRQLVVDPDLLSTIKH